eukprot:scaffold306227_cov35-Tisochrysis_lutea.AAC.1
MIAAAHLRLVVVNFGLINSGRPQAWVPAARELGRAAEIAASSGDVRLEAATALAPGLHVLCGRRAKPRNRHARATSIGQGDDGKVTRPRGAV